MSENYVELQNADNLIENSSALMKLGPYIVLRFHTCQNIFITFYSGCSFDLFKKVILFSTNFKMQEVFNLSVLFFIYVTSELRPRF